MVRIGPPAAWTVGISGKSTLRGRTASRKRGGRSGRPFVRHAPGEHTSYAFAVDQRGKLVWESSDVDGDHLVAVLGERVSDEYLAQLRDRGVSYPLAGARELDLGLALEKIAARFGVRTLMREGGGGINGSFLRAGLVDEVSLLVAPVADGRLGTASLFDVAGDGVSPRGLTLQAVDRRVGDVLWLRYLLETS